MSLFHKFKRLLEPTDSANNFYDNSRCLIDGIIAALRPMAGGDNADRLHLWLADEAPETLVLTVESGRFRELLITELYNQRHDSLANGAVEIHRGTAPEGTRLLPLPTDFLSLSLGPLPSVKSAAQAPTAVRLRLVEGTGRALRDTLDLKPGADRSSWNVGRGSDHRLADRLRHNDFVVNDGEPEADHGAVSRAHCTVSYRDGEYYIQANAGGCRLEGGAATKVVSAATGTVSELQCSRLQRRLHPGDIIELGKSVRIIFETI